MSNNFLLIDIVYFNLNQGNVVLMFVNLFNRIMTNMYSNNRIINNLSVIMYSYYRLINYL